MTLDITSLQRAIAQADEAIDFCGSDLAKDNPRLMVHLKAGAIQAFEFTYELTFKTLKRYFEMSEVSLGEIDSLSFNEIVRKGLETRLLNADLIAWKQFRKDRGTTSHAYDEDKADEIFQSIPAFLEEAKFFVRQIYKRADEL